MRCSRCQGFCIRVELRDMVTDERAVAMECLNCSCFFHFTDAQPFGAYQHHAAPEPVSCEGVA